MKEHVKYYSNSEEITQEIASTLAKKVKFGLVLALIGNLGTGKTLFARGFARGLGISEIVCSPTFNIIREYHITGANFLYHMDLYRINNSDEAIAFGIEDYINNPNSISLIEWPERIYAILPANIIRVEIKRVSETVREVIITL